jgi:hypothetical protein
MKAYVAITGALFALLTFAHLWRIVAENRNLAFAPDFVIITAISAALSVWALRLWNRLGGRGTRQP